MKFDIFIIPKNETHILGVSDVNSCCQSEKTKGIYGMNNACFYRYNVVSRKLTHSTFLLSSSFDLVDILHAL